MNFYWSCTLTYMEVLTTYSGCKSAPEIRPLAPPLRNRLADSISIEQVFWLAKISVIVSLFWFWYLILYDFYAQFLCRIYLYDLFVRSLCTISLYDFYVRSQCPMSKYDLYIRSLSTMSMYDLFVRSLSLRVDFWFMFSLEKRDEKLSLLQEMKL